jgi:Protein of unknown function (DUF2750)
MKNLSAEEIASVTRQDGATRYAHFVKQVADWQQVWGLRAEDGWVAVSDDSGASMFPVWPHAEYARLLATDDWQTAVPTAIELTDWLEEWLPNLAEVGDMVAVFPTPAGQGVPVDPVTVRSDIEAELSKLEDDDD